MGMSVDDIIARHPGSELFRDLLVADNEDELETLAADLSKRVGKVKAKKAESQPPSPPATGVRRADGYVEGSAKTTEEAVTQRDMQSYLRLKRAEAEKAHRDRR